MPGSYWSSLSSRQQRAVMMHESEHLRRGDIWRDFLLQSITVMHWFNPLAWWALRQARCASETACDRRVSQFGRRHSTAFAAALVQLLQWESGQAASVPTDQLQIPKTGVGFQSMAAPPVHQRVVELLSNPKHSGDSPMKRFALIAVTITMLAIGLCQFQLTTANEPPDDAAPANQDGSTSAPATEEPSLQILSPDQQVALKDLVSRLDTSDETTASFLQMLKKDSGQIALQSVQQQIEQRYQQRLRGSAIDEYADHYLKDTADGGRQYRQLADLQRLTNSADVILEGVQAFAAIGEDLSGTLDHEDATTRMLARLLSDDDGGAALMITELNGGDTATRYVSKKLERVIVRGKDGTFGIVPSQRERVIERITVLRLGSDAAKKIA
ncbi:MAG: M56 family metallopeptidase, partial [Planctomycetota bacterium]